MLQTVSGRKGNRYTWLFRLLGLGLVGLLLARLDLAQVQLLLRQANGWLVMLAVPLVIPLILIKTIRWQGILSAQAIHYRLYPAFLSYFGSIFIGFLTPGRLGEFVKAFHVSHDQDVPLAQGFASVLADRLFDLYALLLVGLAAVFVLAEGPARLVPTLGLLGLSLSLVILLNETLFGRLKQLGRRLGWAGHKLFHPDGWLLQIRAGLRRLTWPWLLATVGWTVFSYLIFFGQCYLLALALDLPVDFLQVSYAVALGSLVTLLPLSISGLGTREATMIAYLGTLQIPAEAALSFSLLIFVTFYLAGGLMGAVAWWLKPLPLTRGRGFTLSIDQAKL